MPSTSSQFSSWAIVEPGVVAGFCDEDRRNKRVSSVPLRPNDAVLPSFATRLVPTPSLPVLLPGVEYSIVPELGEEEEDGMPGPWRSAILLVRAITVLLSGVATGDGVARGRVEELLDPLEELGRCRGTRPAADALLLELDEGLPATISRRPGDVVPLSAKTRDKGEHSQLFQLYTRSEIDSRSM